MTMTDTAVSTIRTVDARGSFCPGPLMELIRAIREASGRRRDRRLLLRQGIEDRTSPSGSRRRAIGCSALETRDGYDEIIVEKVR